MDTINRLKSTLKEELRGNYYAISNVKEAEIVTINEELNQMDECLEKLEVRMETAINSSGKKTSSETAVNKINNDAVDKFEIKTKIPPLVLPEFSGKYEEFNSFKAQFDDLITNNIQLSQSQKLYNLRSCLTHDARDSSSKFDNFESLYEALITRYDNERLIVDIHVQNILKFEKIQSESAKEIRNMIVCIQKNLRALKALKYEQNKLSGVLLINILMQKLDKESRKSFELLYDSKNVPTFELNKTAVFSDIKQAFLQICLAEEHKDAVQFLWSNVAPCVHKKPKLHVYCFNRVNFGVSSSPFLLAATIRHHIENYKNDFPDTVLLLYKCFYVDDLISGGKDFEEALQLSRSATNIMEAAGMDIRKWISNDANLMEQWKKETFDVYPVDKTVSFGVNTTKVLGLSWDTHEDYLTMDTSLSEFVSIDKNTKRFILQAVRRIFEPLGLITPFTIRVKCLIKDLWSEKIPWDDLLPPHIEKE
ncbi:hypothetical protein AVEN_257433-1 [Araneus ventricosus]|uniref:Reverse transcriptase domain-containing protein n=1 Tax=Araneus ventricosus TaxID=182803 RepID=A0A4Y2FCP0_ARAVE|nr:hypothetical protein AVEN_257433-1 [Araneus ventricosus]